MGALQTSSSLSNTWGGMALAGPCVGNACVTHGGCLCRISGHRSRSQGVVGCRGLHDFRLGCRGLDRGVAVDCAVSECEASPEAAAAARRRRFTRAAAAAAAGEGAGAGFASSAAFLLRALAAAPAATPGAASSATFVEEMAGSGTKSGSQSHGSSKRDVLRVGREPVP